ncbi:unnamed protein product [Protopolystoma xenopodis]|uniref:Uncharacterized protein n=1 Tax=Protopolystoma xenopodis TaxID=117903 RepID=A0A3S4ZDL6_9PLAT|nr:unnamed protein product [Protopolystoma xenopodis]
MHLLSYSDVHIGAVASLPLELYNRSPVQAIVEFRLNQRRHHDFRFDFRPEEGGLEKNSAFTTDLIAGHNQTRQNSSRANYSLPCLPEGSVVPPLLSHQERSENKIMLIRVLLQPNSRRIGQFIFQPTEVASHDFLLDALVNGQPQARLPPTADPGSPTSLTQTLNLPTFRVCDGRDSGLAALDQVGSRIRCRRRQGIQCMERTLCRRVRGMGLCKPLEMTPDNFKLSFDCYLPDCLEQSEGKPTLIRDLVLTSMSKTRIGWSLGIREIKKFNAGELGELNILYASDNAGIGDDGINLCCQHEGDFISGTLEGSGCAIKMKIKLKPTT